MAWLEGGERREQRTDTPATMVAERVARLGCKPDALEVTRPSLEDVYLDPVGHEHAVGITADSLNDTVAR